MLTAINDKGMEIILPLRSKMEIERLRDSKFYCPVCHQRVMMKVGSKVIPHFAHYQNDICPTSNQGESEYHEQGKIDLYNWLRSQHVKAKLEVYIAKIKQRPDILFKWNNNYFVIEFQFAQIPPELLYKRTISYKRLGITPIWILGDKRIKRKGFNQMHITDFEFQFFQQFSPDISIPSLISYSPESKLLTRFSNPYPNKSKVYGRRVIAPLKNISIQTFFTSEILPLPLLYDYWLQDKIKFRSFRSNFIAHEDRKFLKWLYQQGQHPQYLPSIIHLPVQSHFLFQTPVYIWQSEIILKYLHPLGISGILNYKIILGIRGKQSRRLNCAHSLLKDSPIKEYLNLLTKLGYLIQRQEGLFQKVKPFQFHKTLDQSIYGDKLIIKQLKDTIN